jgi:hypothetical protein
MNSIVRFCIRVLLISTFALSESVSAFDINASIDFLVNNGAINKQSSVDWYRLNDNLTRAEILKMAIRPIAGIQNCTLYTPRVFQDVWPHLWDLCGYIEAGAQYGIVSSGWLLFRPNDPVTRAEMTKILLKTYQYKPSTKSSGFKDVNGSLGDLEWYINKVVEVGCNEDRYWYRPNAQATRLDTFILEYCLGNDYLKESRDYARKSDVRNISIALGAYFADTETYPSEDVSGCIPTEWNKGGLYLSSNIPTDPIKWRVSVWCDWSNGQTYSYRTFTGSFEDYSGLDYYSLPVFVVGVELEGETSGNSSASIDTIASSRTFLREHWSVLVYWSWKYYYYISADY